MLTATFGDARADVVAVLNRIPVVGPALVSAMPTAERYVKDQAKAGAEEAIPDITAKVHDEASSTIRPYILGIGAVSLLALGGTIAALIKIKRR